MLTREEAEHIAKLAKLELTDEEFKKFIPQLSEILDYVDTLNEVDTESVEPTFHAIEGIKNRFQEKDNKDQRLSRKDVLRNAKEHNDTHIFTDAVL